MEKWNLKRAAGLSLGVLVGFLSGELVSSNNVAFWVLFGCLLIASILYFTIDWEKAEEEWGEGC